MLATVFTLSCVLWGAWGFPDGAPVDACVKPRPNQPYHGQARTQPLNTLPYRVIASSSTYGPNTPITVTIEGSESFKGFFLQARSAETDEWLGGWELAPNTTTHQECAAITHADPKEKARATLVWRAPNNAQGRVYFTGTVLKNFGTFWAGLVAQPADEPLLLQQPFGK